MMPETRKEATISSSIEAWAANKSLTLLSSDDNKPIK